MKKLTVLAASLLLTAFAHAQAPSSETNKTPDMIVTTTTNGVSKTQVVSINEKTKSYMTEFLLTKKENGKDVLVNKFNAISLEDVPSIVQTGQNVSYIKAYDASLPNPIVLDTLYSGVTINWTGHEAKNGVILSSNIDYNNLVSIKRICADEANPDVCVDGPETKGFSAENTQYVPFGKKVELLNGKNKESLLSFLGQKDTNSDWSLTATVTEVK